MKGQESPKPGQKLLREIEENLNRLEAAKRSEDENTARAVKSAKEILKILKERTRRYGEVPLEDKNYWPHLSDNLSSTTCTHSISTTVGIPEMGLRTVQIINTPIEGEIWISTQEGLPERTETRTDIILDENGDIKLYKMTSTDVENPTPEDVLDQTEEVVDYFEQHAEQVEYVEI